MTIFRSVLIGMFCAVFALPDRVWAVDFFEAVTGVGQCPGNYKTATDMLKKQPSLANFTHKFGGQEESILEGVIRGCCIADDSEYKDCRRGNKKKNRDQMAQLLIDNHADIDRVIERKIYIGRNSRGEETVHGTLLDYVRALKESQNCWKYGSAFCDKIEAAMVKAGAKTYAELNGDASAPGQGNTGTTGTPSSNVTGGCTLEFAADGNRKTKLEHVESASMGSQCDNDGKDCRHTTWDVAGSYFFVTDDENNSDFALLDTDDGAPSLAKLIKVNGESVDVGHLFEGSGNVYFECGKYIGVQYCLDGYRGENQLGLRLGDANLPVYEKCVKDEAGTDGSQGDAGTETNETSGKDAEQKSAPESVQPQNVKPTDNSKQIADAEKAYNDARERENSLENRMLGGLTMAATGIGGMQLAQGLAEQNADKKAEQDMAAYLATFQCKVGDKGGKSYSGGEMGIEVGGTNQLVNLYQQYVDLAASLKERKTALGMAPGIESQVVMDKANMGLYDAEGGKGIENGTYASLYRASRGNETDAQKLAEQKNTSATRVKAGAIAAGAGVVGGIVGNQLINGDKDKVNEADCKKAGGAFKDGKCNCSGKKVYKDGKCVESAVSNLSAKAGEVLGSKVAPDQTSTTPDQSTDEESTGDDETVSEDKIKECVQYINENVHFVGPFKEHNCERLAIKLDDSLFLALTNEEAAALSTVWDWGCSSVDTDKLYGAGSHDIDKDACTTVENMKNFVANSKKTCDEYSGYETQNMVDWTVCLPKSWGPEVLDDDTDDATTEEQEPVASIESQRIKGGACLEQDLPTNATKGHYITTGRNNLDCKDGIKCSCAAQECRTGFTVKKVNGKSQGYCVKK